MASPSGTSSGSGGEDLRVSTDQRKRKRMLSNRESAKRSRLRKKKHLDGLAAQVERIRKENNEILATLNITTQYYLNIESENSVLRAQMGELSHRLQSLNDIINYLHSSAIDLESQNHQTSIDDFINPWNLFYQNQAIVTSTDMFEY
ncbi:hypothetical protein IFM89_010705 [Coptis chinensis]|uniref:BZIP domain-containing protein n=1 Tax=Coptis chinensis TaxID=261450 RepID=A0A835ILK0_9MAGN|nr:hypothetical protein IFM89_010705 [Coptis chinensis]